MTDANDLLAAYDAQLRGEGEVQGASSWERVGPLWRATYHGRGFVTYESLVGYDLVALVGATVAHYADETDLASFEWKTRGHDDLPGLEAVLDDHGLVAEEAETVMVGEAAALAVDVPLRDGLVVRRLDGDPEADALLAAATAVQREVFGETGDLAEHVALGEGRIEVWGVIDEADGARMVSCGRLQVVAGTEFAGLWGGATLPRWRGLGIYRALTAARARSALTRGVRLMHSDCSPMSRPILERSGLVPVTTTTPYVWSRGAA